MNVKIHYNKKLTGSYFITDDVRKVKSLASKLRNKAPLVYRGKGSNLHAQSAPDPKSGVSTNSTTAA